MSKTSRLFAGVVLLMVPTIEFGGYFLLRILSGLEDEIDRGSLTFSFFRAGHAHAGVLVLLALVSFVLVDMTAWSDRTRNVIRVLVTAAPLLVSGGFFGGGGLLADDRPGPLIGLAYAGALALATGLVLLGVGLLRAKSP